MSAILYSYDQCPYCIRSIAALSYAKIDFDIRSVDIDNLPTELKDINASVPYLILENDDTIDESWEIVKWALKQHDLDNWLGNNNIYLREAEMLIETNDHSFVTDLYDYIDAENPKTYRKDCEEYIEELEEMLNEYSYLQANHITLADISIVSFVKLFAEKESKWFAQAPYPKCRQWLSTVLETPWLITAFTHH